MTKMCDGGKHKMVTESDSIFLVCKICKRFYVPIKDLTDMGENTITICRFCGKDFDDCTCEVK